MQYMKPEVVKAAAVRFELGEEPDAWDASDDSEDDEPEPTPAARAKRRIVWGEGVAAADGNSAQKLHEVWVWVWVWMCFVGGCGWVFGGWRWLA
jgi:hypothetical protein